MTVLIGFPIGKSGNGIERNFSGHPKEQAIAHLRKLCTGREAAEDALVGFIDWPSTIRGVAVRCVFQRNESNSTLLLGSQ